MAELISWSAARRLDYIDFRMVTVGSIRRTDIMRTFGVSLPQASADLHEFQALYPRSLVYDKSAKLYRPRKKYTTRRGLTTTVLAAIVILQMTNHPMGWK